MKHLVVHWLPRYNNASGTVERPAEQAGSLEESIGP
jgi:hypothetical protein